MSAIPGCGVLPPFEPRPRSAADTGVPLKPAGRFAVLNTFVDASMKHIGGTAVKVWLILYRDTKPDGLARAGDVDMAKRAGVSTRSIQTARGALVKAQLLEVVRRGTLWGGASVYRVRPLTAEAGFRCSPEKRRTGLRKPASGIPERDQKGHPDPLGSGAQKKNARARRPGA